MGFLFPLPPPPTAYPDAVDCLEPGERLVLRAVRHWRDRFRTGDDAVEGLERLFRDHAVGHGTPACALLDGALSVSAWLRVVSRTARRPVAVLCQGCPRLAADEARLLHAVAAAQRHDLDAAAAALRPLLTATGVEFALGPVEGLARILDSAGLFLRRRRAPGPEA